MKTTITYFNFLFLILGLSFSSCKEYLDIKPDKKLAIPYTGDDLQAILDYIERINYSNLGLAEVAADNFFLPYENWLSLMQEENRDAYLWRKNPVYDSYWSLMYRKIYDANTVLDYADKVQYKSEEQKKQIYGNALFIRGMAFHKLAEVFSVPYDKATAKDRLGVVLKLSSDINEKVERSSLEQTYQQIKIDLEKAIQYLPSAMPEYPTRASKAAAYGVLARYYLSMRLYEEAAAYADSCLAIKSDLLDYNSVAKNNPYPFELYNAEVIYNSRSSQSQNLSERNARLDTVLFGLYEKGDLRKELFFTEQADNYYSFTGDYSVSSTDKFDGITTAEMMLVNAETMARTGKLVEAVSIVSKLLRNRYDKSYFINDFGVPTEQAELIDFIILERRKELIGRGQRWSDIRRLSFDKELTLTRMLNSETYQMKSKDIREFAFLLPRVVIERSGMKQNE